VRQKQNGLLVNKLHVFSSDKNELHAVAENDPERLRPDGTRRKNARYASSATLAAPRGKPPGQVSQAVRV
jgi:hypothetical protein